MPTTSQHSHKCCLIFITTTIIVIIATGLAIVEETQQILTLSPLHNLWVNYECEALGLGARLMRSVFLQILILLCVQNTLLAQSLSITGPDKEAMLEGQTYSISWRADGVDKINIIAYGTRTPLGTESRGDFSIPVAQDIPASQGMVSWSVPWIDSISFHIKLQGFDSTGRQIAEDERTFGFRPAVLANRLKNGIYLDLHLRYNQRLYVQKDRRITHVYISTSSQNYFWLPRNVHVTEPHDHAGVFKVLDKSPMHYSILFDVEMPWAMRYLGGHFIHATLLERYATLGEAASSGCNRLTEYDAHELYNATPVGTRVEIIGPEG